MRRKVHAKNAIKAALILAALVVFAASCLRQEQKQNVPLTASETPEPPAIRASDSDFSSFSHKVPEHKQFDCVSCHRREAGSRELKFTGHESCIGCHLSQFTNTNEKRAMCMICHDKLDTVPPTIGVFPVRFQEGFNMKFDHEAHNHGRGRPPDGCSSCHSPSGPGQSIPAGVGAHSNCYTCHTPESKIGSCNVCHELAPYSRTPQSRYVFKAVFTHGDHRGVSCDDCHTVLPGAAQSRQVTHPVPVEHTSAAGVSCQTCHNGSRAFGGNGANDFANCARCHKGSGFDMLPGTPR